MEALKYLPYIVLMIAVGGMVAGAGAISISKFGSTMSACEDGSDYTFNATSETCYNSSNYDGFAATEQYLATVNSNKGIGDIAEQFPTISIIGIMVVIISLIAGVFVYMKYFA